MSRNELQVEDFLSGYETRIYRGYKKTAGDKLKDKKVVASTIQEALTTGVVVQTDDGEVLEVPLIVNLVALKLQYFREHPDKIDLKELSTILGEQKQEIVIDTQKASDIFKGVAVGDVIDDSSIE
jgi:hypothetical protein